MRRDVFLFQYSSCQIVPFMPIYKAFQFFVIVSIDDPKNCFFCHFWQEGGRKKSMGKKGFGKKVIKKLKYQHYLSQILRLLLQFSANQAHNLIKQFYKIYNYSLSRPSITAESIYQLGYTLAYAPFRKYYLPQR